MYLSLALSMCKLTKSSLLVLVDQMADRVPAWKGRLLHHSGRLSLINSTLAAIPVYTTMSQELPTWILRAFEKIFKAFLWMGSEVVHGGKCLVAWSRVQRSLKLGGLEVPDIKQMGKALRLCWLWQQRVEQVKPWVALPLSKDAVTKAFFKSSIRCIVGDGRSTLFWLDPWVDGKSIADFAPHLFAVAHPRCRNRRTVAAVLDQNAWMRDIVGALTVPVLLQYMEVRERMEAMVLNHSTLDATILRWCGSGLYSVRSAYSSMFIGQSVLQGV
jgi:hypothetical protein